MPKRSRSGVVSRPARVVAPISVNGGRSSVTTFAPGADAERDRQLAVLHRRIERLLQRAREAVDLVDEEHARGSSAVRKRGDVALALERRAGGLHERRRRAPRRRSAPATSCRGRAGRRAARGRAPRRARRRPRSRPRAGSLTASWPTKSSSRRGRSDASSSSSSRSCGVWTSRRRRACGSPARRLQRVGDQVLGRVAGGAVEQLLGLLRASSRARAGRRGRACADRRRGVTTIGSSPAAAPTFSRSSTTIRSAVRLPIPGTAWRRAVSPAATRGEQLARRAAGEHGERHLRPDAPGRRAAAGTGRAPPRWRSRRACSASSRTIRWRVQRRLLARRAGTWRSVSAETARR